MEKAGLSRNVHCVLCFVLKTVKKSFFKRTTLKVIYLCVVFKPRPPSLADTYLQWTTMGPASEGLHVLTRRRKARMGVGYSGTPWSGQAMNWNCRTSLFSLEPFCTRWEQHTHTERLEWERCPGSRLEQPQDRAEIQIYCYRSTVKKKTTTQIQPPKTEQGAAFLCFFLFARSGMPLPWFEHTLCSHWWLWSLCACVGVDNFHWTLGTSLETLSWLPVDVSDRSSWRRAFN